MRTKENYSEDCISFRCIESNLPMRALIPSYLEVISDDCII